ncbi:LysR family transcriptional regulator [Atopomonas sediminilitoris]|uniref:LysR family transcriptional regulator n=1 Tax=Atopomonas sediminilitoris TaxID=2919919 RepID=UPI001F4E6B8C|nr:LysR family transcriptional regulator [Atopomonas sediminilitoris]MCJ8168155.1 LysR family transcriptional regulator [Atopomonas sediminilitoris]
MRKELTRMTFRQLHIFRAVCEHASYSRAAEIMGLTQPAVSLQIKQLEELIGQPLFDYVGKKLHLCPAAETLLHTCDNLMEQLHALDMRLSELHGELQGMLQLAVESSAKYLTPHLFAAFRAAHPGVQLSLAVANRAQLIRRLGDNRDDLTLMSQPPQDMALEFLPLLDNPIIAVAPAGHALTHAASLPLSALQEFPLLMREPGSGTRKACEEFLQQQRVHIRHGMELMSQEAQREGVLAGLGLALLPRHAVRQELSNGSLCELPIEGLPFKRSWCLLYPRQKRLSPVAEAFYSFCQRERLSLQRQLA